MYKRAGIIPYFQHTNNNTNENEIYVILMISVYDNKIIDMGGHVEQGESFVEAGLREAIEESRNFFHFEKTHIKDSHEMSNRKRNQFIYFVPIDYTSPISNLKDFAMAYRSSFMMGTQYNDPPHTLENKDFVFLTLNEIDNILLGEKVKISDLNEHIKSYFSNEEYPAINENIKYFLETFVVKMKIKMNSLNDL